MRVRVRVRIKRERERGEDKGRDKRGVWPCRAMVLEKRKGVYVDKTCKRPEARLCI